MLEQQSILALLQTFEVTARHLSFTLAAHEMNLTQERSAIGSAGWRCTSGFACLSA